MNIKVTVNGKAVECGAMDTLEALVMGARHTDKIRIWIDGELMMAIPTGKYVWGVGFVCDGMRFEKAVR